VDGESISSDVALNLSQVAINFPIDMAAMEHHSAEYLGVHRRGNRAAKTSSRQRMME
jgi:hypothetical protein